HHARAAARKGSCRDGSTESLFARRARRKRTAVWGADRQPPPPSSGSPSPPRRAPGYANTARTRGGRVAGRRHEHTRAGPRAPAQRRDGAASRQACAGETRGVESHPGRSAGARTGAPDELTLARSSEGTLVRRVGPRQLIGGRSRSPALARTPPAVAAR